MESLEVTIWEGVMRGMEPFQFPPLVKGATESSDNLELWLSSW